MDTIPNATNIEISVLCLMFPSHYCIIVSAISTEGRIMAAHAPTANTGCTVEVMESCYPLMNEIGH
jgi:hypothetical protein